MKTIFIRTVMVAIILFVSTAVRTQEYKYNLGLNYATEVQSDFGRKVNWANLISLDGQYKPWANGELSLQTISIWKTREEPIMDNFQAFSNIEEKNMAVNIFLMGYTHHFNGISLFGGLRNMNNDYFIGAYTSLFTNSSCGIYPTLSVNFPIANYPLSAMCIHGELEWNDAFVLKNSLYNGTCHELFSKEGSIFTINPKKDGILNVTELSYLSEAKNYGLYTIGSALYTGRSGYSSSEQEEAAAKKKISCILWGSIERSVYSNGNKSVGILLQGSLVPTSKNNCKDYYGAGIILNRIIPTRNENTLGVFFNNASFQETTEKTIEITWKYKVNKHVVLQPALHWVKNASITKTVGLIRLYWDI